MLKSLTRLVAMASCSVLSCIEANCADLQLGSRTKLVFAPAPQARQLLSTRDDFVASLSPFDRSARLKSDRPVDEATYLTFAGDQALDWPADEQASLTAAFDKVKERLIALELNLPEQIWLIKSTGLEEGGAAYTRGAAIIFPRKLLQGGGPPLESLLCHELFHVLSRHDKNLRERLYKAIGFQPCGELQWPEELNQRRLTNPDGPTNDHCIKISVDGMQRWAIPILYSRSATYDPAKGGEFFDYLVFQFIVINAPANSDDLGYTSLQTKATTPSLVDGKVMLVNPKEAVGFLDQVGRNTNYIIHPDEILADNFVIIATAKSEVPSPDVLARIQGVFDKRTP